MRFTPCVAVAFLVPASWSHTGAAADAVFQWVEQADQGLLTLTCGDQPVLQYVYTVDAATEESAFDTAKVFHHVFGPGTEAPITKGPGGTYPHHRGLYVGWNRTTFDGMTQDFWHCRNGETQRHVEFRDRSADADQASMTALIHWIDKSGELVVEETRTVTVQRIESDADPGFGWQIDWSTRIASRRGEVTLDGDRQHAGFQFRAAQYVAEQNNARYVRPDGFPDQPQAFQVNDRDDPNGHVDLGWLAMSFELDGRQFTVEYFESPGMPAPSRYSERPYGRFGAFFKTTVTESEPLEMKYRLIVTTGAAPTREAIQQRYDRFVAESE